MLAVMDGEFVSSKPKVHLIKEKMRVLSLNNKKDL